ncbi:ATP-binding cassette domain-containing protein [Streptomyces sp. NPDC086091]|uniref:ATP-binding cassette domain-containing protein n=1 Tax=Streptomyces sp. NPDC086091 TaxID=3365751 RepID=UPI0038141DBB
MSERTPGSGGESAKRGGSGKGGGFGVGVVSRDGLRLLRDGLRGSRRPLTRIAGWSLLEAAPALASGWVTATAVDRGFLAGRPLHGLAWLGLLASLYVVRATAERALFPHLADIVEPLRDHLVRRLVRASLERAAREGRAADSAAVARLTRQAETVRNLVATLLRTARPLVVTLLAAVAGLTVLDAFAAAVVLPPLLLVLLVFPLSLGSMMRRRRAVVLAEERVAVRTGEVLAAGRDIVALGARDHALSEVEEATTGYVRAAVSAARFAAVRVLLVFLGGHLPLLALLLTGPWLVSSGRMSAGELVGAVTYVTGYLIGALQAVTGSVGGHLTQLGSVLDRLAETAVVEGEAAGSVGHGGAPVPDGYALRVDGLTFGYGPHAAPVLRDLSLLLPEGEHLAIVGASGIGKSTLAGLLAGLETPGAGTVRLGGAEVTALDDTLRARSVALVPQEAYVFHGTVRDNLRYLAAAATDTELRRAVGEVGADAVVDRLGGLDAELTDPAGQLSAGERQLLVLARVFVAPARVVVLDEATCHLDPVAEARAERAFAARPGTLVVIAHRLASARRARRVLLLDGDRADLGTHEQLLAGARGYADLAGQWTAV